MNNNKISFPVSFCNRLILWPLIVLLGLGLFACGGGGGGGGGGSIDDYTISGTVSGDVTSGVTVTLSGASSGTTITDGSGNYSFTGLANGAYTVTPSLAGYTFSSTNLAVTLSGADSTGNDFVSTLGASSISGTVAGTEIVAVNDNGDIVASDDTTGKTADGGGNFPFTLTGIPVGTNIRVYLITGSGVYPLYFGAPSTNVFSLSAVATIDLGFVDTTAVPGQATPENDPTVVTGVSPQAENTDTLVRVTEESTGAPLSGVTVIVDHATDPRQVATTTTAGSASFTPPSSGPVTVTIGMSGYELVTLVDFNLVYLDIPLGDLNQQAFVQGTVSNYTGGTLLGFVIASEAGFDNFCPTCENLYNGTLGDYRMEANLPIRPFNLSAIDFGNGGTNPPTNFTAATGFAPLTDGQTLVVNMDFPITPPTTTTTTGTITVPASLGTINYVTATGLRDVVGNPSGLTVGFSALGNVSPYDYSLVTFDFAGAGPSTTILAQAQDTAGGMTMSFNRGAGFGGTGEDFNLMDIPTNLSPTGVCGGVAPTLSWTAVPGASFYIVGLEGIPSDWEIVIDGGTTSVALPDLTGTPIAALGLSPSVLVSHRGAGL